jgi:hypothetical protein
MTRDRYDVEQDIRALVQPDDLRSLSELLAELRALADDERHRASGEWADIARSNGQSEGWGLGYDVGQQQGQEDGYKRGRAEGVLEGLTRAWEQAQAVQSADATPSADDRALAQLEDDLAAGRSIPS